MSNIKTDSNSSAVISNSNVGDNNLLIENERDQQITKIVILNAKLISYLSVIYFLGVIAGIIYFYFF